MNRNEISFGPYTLWVLVDDQGVPNTVGEYLLRGERGVILFTDAADARDLIYRKLFLVGAPNADISAGLRSRWMDQYHHAARLKSQQAILGWSYKHDRPSIEVLLDG